MDLKDALQKNKHKFLKLASFKMPVPPSIATDDRPYNIDFQDQTQTGNKRVTNSKQTGNKRVTNSKQTGNTTLQKKWPALENGKQTGNKRVTEQVTNISTNGKQTGNIFQEKFSLTRLVGTQRNIVLFFYFLAKKNVSQSTNTITLDHISKSLNITKGVAKTTIIRLQKKGHLSRDFGKEGRGGWSTFTIESQLYQEIMQQERQGFLDGPFYQTGNKRVTEQVTEQVTKVLSSSSSNIYNKTTTTETAQPDPQINVDQLNHIGLTPAHLLQLTKQKKLTPDQIQDSINHFAFDLLHNDKAKDLKKPPLDFFMGILRQGIPYAASNNYESEQSIAMRLYLDSKATVEKKQKELEEKFKDSFFQEWLNTLSDSELMSFYVPSEAKLDGLPEKVQVTIKKRNALDHAKHYFDLEIWPSKRKELLSVKPDVASDVES